MSGAPAGRAIHQLSLNNGQKWQKSQLTSPAVQQRAMQGGLTWQILFIIYWRFWKALYWIRKRFLQYPHPPRQQGAIYVFIIIWFGNQFDYLPMNKFLQNWVSTDISLFCNSEQKTKLNSNTAAPSAAHLLLIRIWHLMCWGRKVWFFFWAFSLQ